MDNVRLKLALCVVSMCLMEVSSLFDFQPAKFARERYERSRNRTTARTMHPYITDHEILDFVGLVNRFGYPGEEHLVTTADGYNLRVHRIPGSPTRPKVEDKPIVFFQHGLLASSDVWILHGPDKDLAYMLADAGYDVWLSNIRGNTYSRSHVKLSPDYDPEFWKFSFHEMALFDVPALIDYILRVTKQQTIIYVGHSMGTTISYVLLSTRPEYNAKIDLVISLSPVAYWHAPLQPAIKSLMKNTATIKNFAMKGGIYEVFPLTANAQLIQTICNEQIFQESCINFYYYFFGYNPKQLNVSGLTYFLSYCPAGGSIQTIIHYTQNIHSGNFQMYDYGLTKNLAMYRQQTPPSYNLDNIVAPVAIYYGEGDVLTIPGNVIELSKKVSNLVTLEAVPDERFNHLDFLLARDLKPLLNNGLMEIISKFSRRKTTL